MNKIKEFVEDNTSVAILSILTCILVVIGLICFSSKDIIKNDEKKVLEEHAYTMYLKEEAIIKLTIRESFYKCGDNICSEYTDKISNVELLNEKAITVYTDNNAKNKDLDEGIGLLLKEAKDKGHEINSLEIISNWKSRYNEDEFKELLKAYMEEVPAYPIVFEYSEELDEQSIIANAEKKTYTITFDSNLGTPVESQIVIENEFAIEPQAPTRDGYDFVKWQYNNRNFSFDTPIDKDYTLRASWKKKPTVSTKSTTKATEAPKDPVQEPATEPTTEKPQEPTTKEPEDNSNNNSDDTTE